MPELPEVQTIANDLNSKAKGAKIIDFWTNWPKAVKRPTASKLKTKIRGARIKRVGRIGKNIIFELSKNQILLVHQKMTGHLMVGKWVIQKGKAKSLVQGPLEEKVNQYIHAIFTLENGKMVALSDMRKFARIAFGPREEILNLPDIKSLGLDALDPKLSFKILEEKLAESRRPIKAVLMDPKVVAGIGNIYADDILWKAKVHPLTPANKVKSEAIREILKHTRIILKKAIKLRGTSVGDYRDTSGEPGSYGKVILVYKRTKSPCKRCKTPIAKTKVGQRSAHFCPQCQKV